MMIFPLTSTAHRPTTYLTGSFLGLDPHVTNTSRSPLILKLVCPPLAGIFRPPPVTIVTSVAVV